MNNEIEQLAEQHGMTVEFVAWFFGEKKAACGSFWLMMMAAMWEGWKGRDGESTAALATIEKCREVSGCPAGVDLQDHLRQLAAESVGLKGALNKIAFTYPLSPHIRGMTTIQAPATDRIVAGIKADGVEEFAKKLESRGRHQDYVKVAYAFAQQLREGAK